MALLLSAGLPLLWLAHAERRVLLVNGTPSEPVGVYLRAPAGPVRAGDLIAFMAPARAFPYADRRLSFLRMTPILKAVAAVAGDEVCTRGRVLAINDVPRAPIRSHDSQGVVLPRWMGCRRLATGEAFVFSNRVPNSFDSRYFGPVEVATARIYRPLITDGEPANQRVGR